MPKTKDKSIEQNDPAQKFGAEPFEIPVLPLRNTTLFPETMVPLSAGRPASVAAVEAALAGEEKLLACVSVRPEKTDDEDTKPADLFEVGTLVMIKRMERVDDTLHLIVQGTDRIRVLNWVQEEPFLRARVQILPYVPREALADSLSSADVHLASLSYGWEGLIVPIPVSAA